MPLVKTLSRIDSNGKLTLPGNIMRFAGFKDGDEVELRLAGAGARVVMISKRCTRGHVSKSGAAIRMMGQTGTCKKQPIRVFSKGAMSAAASSR
ncbi:MAG TPA: hypothetical protein ACFYD2_10740 [Candidatus Avalokitesvara rifleensis]|uniref:hypothetical protein n=1 Tax=Candidatus Avalokitesvara rifleensis TaxID=3367620 RepID=UPI0040295A0A